MTAHRKGDHWFLSDGSELRSIKPWTKPDSWCGKHWDGWFVALGRSRDSRALEESNFRVLQARLDALPAMEVDDSRNAHGYHAGRAEVIWERVDGVQVVRESHWAVGWVEWIAIHESNEAALRVADDAMSAIEDYPILDESDWSDLEHEQVMTWWENESLRWRIRMCADDGESIFAARRDCPPERVYEHMREHV